MSEMIDAGDLLEIQRLYVELIGDWDHEGFGSNEWGAAPGRKGVFDPPLTVWLMMLQGMTGSSMKDAVGQLRTGAADVVLRRKNNEDRARELSLNTGAYSQAKKRLPLEDVEDVVAVLNRALIAERGNERVHGYRVAVIDGTNLLLERGIKMEELFRCVYASHAKLNHPEMRVVFATDLVSGVSTNPQYAPVAGPKAMSEQRLSAAVIEELDPETLIVGDINFGVFSVVSHAIGKGRPVLFRLQESRARQFLNGERSAGTLDKKVVWRKSRYDQKLADEDLDEVEGRFVRVTLREADFKPLTLYFFTTAELTTDQVVELYGKRVNIETDIRYLKQMFKLHRMQSKTPANLIKELLVRFVALNLLRRIVANVAPKIGLLPREISFKHAVMVINIYGVKLMTVNSSEERQRLMDEFLVAMRQGRLPKRKKRRHEPRMVTVNGERYKVMKGSRAAARRKMQKNGNNY